MDISSGLAGLLGALIGAGASIWMSYINNNKSHDLQTDLEKLKRDNVSKDFQRETLIKVEEGLFAAVKLNNQIFLMFLFEYKDKEIDWSKPTIPEKISEDLRENFKTVRSNNERLINSVLREKIYLFQNQISRSIDFQRNKQQVINELTKINNKYDIVIKMIGAEIRKTY